MKLRPTYPPDPGERLPEWVEGLDERPLVYVTLGTIFNDLSVFRVLLDALADVDCNVVATIGRDGDPDALGPLPGNAHVERYIAQSLLLPRCAVTVGHGGSGSTLAALTEGVPLLLVPRGADQFENAERCEELGAARVVMPDELTGEAVRAEVVTLLEESSYRDRAARARSRDRGDALTRRARSGPHRGGGEVAVTHLRRRALRAAGGATRSARCRRLPS